MVTVTAAAAEYGCPGAVTPANVPTAAAPGAAVSESSAGSATTASEGDPVPEGGGIRGNGARGHSDSLTVLELRS